MTKTLNFVHFSLGIGAGVAFLVACSANGNTPSLGGSSVAAPQSIAGKQLIRSRSPIAHSWFKTPPKGTTGTIWASDVEYGSVDMIAYPTGTLVGQVSGFVSPGGICSDKSGNVYVADADTLYEINNSGSVIKSWATGGYTFGCSVAPNGDVEATNFTPGSVIIFPGGGPTGLSYPAPGGGYLGLAGYDPHGNLFAVCSGGSQCRPSLAELPAGSGNWVLLKFSGTLYPGAVQNVGKYLGIADQDTASFETGIELVQISGSTATERKVLNFVGSCSGKYIDDPSSWGTIDTKPDGVSKKKAKGFILTNLDCFPSPLEIYGKNGGSTTGTITALPYQYDYGVTFTKP